MKSVSPVTRGAKSRSAVVSRVKTRARPKRVLLFSPIPPMKTGTAHYLELVLAELASTGIDRNEVSIVVDEAFLADPVIGREFLGFPIISYRQVTNVVGADELRVYFLANNEFHAYCFASLSNTSRCAGGKIVSVIHEPSCFMLLNHLSSNAQYTFDDSQMAAAMRHQFGDKAEFVLKSRRSDLLPFEAEFLISVQGQALSKSDEIWTHSEFARLKLLLESHFERPVPIIASAHPDMPTSVGASISVNSTESESAPFRIGMFGWVAPSKRVNPVIEAFAWALQTLPPERQKEYELLIVGQLPPRNHYDPEGLAQARDIMDRVRFLGFVETDEFQQLVDSCGLILNLRFPSCGETSGTLERALSSGVPVITTSYQAFAELPNSGQVSAFWPREAAQLFGLFCRIFNDDIPCSRPHSKQFVPSISSLIHSNMLGE